MPLRRLDDGARAVVQLSNEIAHEFELDYVGTEHILLAIMRHNDNIAAKSLHKLGLTEKKVRKAVEEYHQRAKEGTWVFGRLPGSPHYRNVIERAMEVADQLEAQSIGSEHLLLALYHDKESTARGTLTGLGISLKKCRDEILRQISAK